MHIPAKTGLELVPLLAVATSQLYLVLPDKMVYSSSSIPPDPTTLQLMSSPTHKHVLHMHNETGAVILSPHHTHIMQVCISLEAQVLSCHRLWHTCDQQYVSVWEIFFVFPPEL